MKKIVVLGGGGFIGGHLISKLKSLGNWVRGVDIKYNEFKKTDADEFIIADLRDPIKVDVVIDHTIDEVYQLAADMGCSTYINTGEHDSDVMHNSCMMINLNVLKTCSQKNVRKIFYSSSVFVYPEHNQIDPNNPKCSEDSTYPPEPEIEYGWEKLFSERLYFAFHKDFPRLDIRVARFHNIYGPYGTYDGGKEKAPAAFCRKVTVAQNGDEVEVVGDGKQISFLFIDDCIEGILRMMESSFKGPMNIGSDEMINMNDFMKMIIKISGKKLTIKNIDFHGVGIRGRNSDNNLIKDKLGWEPLYSLEKGIHITYDWINNKITEDIVYSYLCNIR